MPSEERFLYPEGKFLKGTKVCIANRAFLEHFATTWKYHHKLQPEQIAYADRMADVEKVGYYHGGDVLYWLVDIPGVWHESCLCPPK
jgi:hypothetical protein